MSPFITIVGGSCPTGAAASTLATTRRAALITPGAQVNGHVLVERLCADFALPRHVIEDADFQFDDLLACWDLTPMALFDAAIRANGDVVVDAGDRLPAVLAAPTAISALADRLIPLGWGGGIGRLRAMAAGWQVSQTGRVAVLAISDGSLPAQRSARRNLTLAAWHGLPAAAVDPAAQRSAFAPFAVLSAVTNEFSEPAPAVETGPVQPDGGSYRWTITLPGVEGAELALRQVAGHLVIDVAGFRRRRALPAVLRRCQMVAASCLGWELTIAFEPDPKRWPERLRLPQGVASPLPDGLTIPILDAPDPQR